MADAYPRCQTCKQVHYTGRACRREDIEAAVSRITCAEVTKFAVVPVVVSKSQAKRLAAEGVPHERFVTASEPAPKAKRGRRPKGDRPMTAAERKRAQRARSKP